MKLVLRYVEEHYTEPVSIEDMAALTYYSKSHFMKFFKLHMGTGFIEYLNDYRLTIAGQKLKILPTPFLRLLKNVALNTFLTSTGFLKENMELLPENTEAAYTEAASVFPVFLTLLFLSMRNVLRMII